MSEAERSALTKLLDPFRHALGDFRLPSASTLGRYVKGYVDGYSNHHPLVHIPTFSIASRSGSPGFVLALLAVGAQYRYETKAARRLYHAARAVTLGHQNFGLSCPGKADTPSCDVMDWLRSLILMATYVGCQRDRNSIHESIECQMLIASRLRNIPMPRHTESKTPDSWRVWASTEENIRTIFSAYCLLVKSTILYDTPPLVLNHELDLPLPCSCREWVAGTQSEWLAARVAVPPPLSFRECFRTQLSTTPEQYQAFKLTLSPMATYVLIHALLQRIYMANSLSPDWDRTSLPRTETDALHHALDNWHTSWKQSPETAHDLHDTYGSLAFSSTALLGIAHVRLQCNLGPWRHLSSCDPSVIAAKLKECPLPPRSLDRPHALLHAVHALRISVHVGVAYLARRQSFSWSLYHVFCGLEFAVFASKWIHVVADNCSVTLLTGELALNSTPSTPNIFPLLSMPHPAGRVLMSTDYERQIIRWIVRIVSEGLESHDETSGDEYQIPCKDDEDLKRPLETLRFLEFAVPALWAQMFVSCNSPWPTAQMIGESLQRFADLLRDDATYQERQTHSRVWNGE